MTPAPLDEFDVRCAPSPAPMSEERKRSGQRMAVRVLMSYSPWSTGWTTSSWTTAIRRADGARGTQDTTYCAQETSAPLNRC